jgi:hypothetical protein
MRGLARLLYSKRGPDSTTMGTKSSRAIEAAVSASKIPEAEAAEGLVTSPKKTTLKGRRNMRTTRDDKGN